MAEAGLTVGRARLAGPGAGQGRALLGPALEAVPLDRLGLPPGALLLVPRLASPRPLRPGPARADFADGVARGLAQALAEAERDPVTGIAPHPRLFTSAAAHWAWKIGAMQDGLIAPVHHPPALHPATPADVRGRLLPDGCLLPAVLVRLTDARRAARFLERLAPGEIAVATAAVAAVHGLAPPSAEAEPVPVSVAAGRVPAMPAPLLPSRLARVLAAAVAVDPGVALLSPEARRLLLLASDVAKHPDDPRAAASLASLPVSAFALSPALMAPEKALHRPTPLSARRCPAEDRLKLECPKLVPENLLPTHASRPGYRAPAGPRVSSLQRPVAAAGTAEPAPRPIAAHGFPRAIRSRYAGLLFLLNALVVLGLTPGPAEPRARGLAPFPILVRLGGQLFGREFAADPLAALLAAGAEGVYGPLTGAPASRGRALRRRARRLVPAGRRTCLLGPSRLLDRDPTRHAALLARRLVRRLAAAGVRIADLRLAGAVQLSDTHLEASFALADLPLAVRLSGLDRDPGFLPLAGRVVRFHFV